jgi:hypothetical protein
MMCPLTPHRRQYDNVSGFPIFPIRNASFAEIEDQFGCPPLDVFISIPERSVEERSSDLQTLLLLTDNFHLDDLFRMAKDK